MASLSFPPGHAIYEEAKRVWNEKHRVAIPSRDPRPTSATAAVGSKRRAPTPDQPVRPTPVHWDEEDESMEDFAAEDATEVDNSALIAFMQDVKNKVMDSLNDLASQDPPRKAFESAPTCSPGLVTARADVYALGYVFGQIANFLDDLEHSLPGANGSFSVIAEHAFGAGFRSGHARNYAVQEWVEARRDGPQKGPEEADDVKALRDMIRSEFHELKSRITNLEGHVPREQMPAAAIRDRGLYASIHAPNPTQGRPSYAATAATAPPRVQQPSIRITEARQTQPLPSKKFKRGITANTQIAARSKNGHTLSFSVDPLPVERSAIDTFATVKKLFNKLDLKSDRLIRATWSDRPHLLIHVGKESKPAELGPRLSSALQDLYRQTTPTAEVIYHPFSEGFQIWVPNVPIRNPETDTLFTPDELQQQFADANTVFDEHPIIAPPHYLATQETLQLRLQEDRHATLPVILTVDKPVSAYNTFFNRHRGVLYFFGYRHIIKEPRARFKRIQCARCWMYTHSTLDCPHAQWAVHAPPREKKGSNNMVPSSSSVFNGFFQPMMIQRWHGPGTHAQAWPAISHFWQQHRLPDNSIICGDFNAHPIQWDTDSVFRRGGQTTQTRTVFFQRWLESHPEIRVADDPTAHTFHAHNTEGTHPDAIMYKGPDLPPLEITWTAVPIRGIRSGHTINSVSTHCSLSVIPRETLLLPNSLINRWTEALGKRIPDEFWHKTWEGAGDLDRWVQRLFDYSKQATEDATKPASLKTFVWWWNDQTDELMNSDQPDKLYKLMQQRRDAYADVREQATAGDIWKFHLAGRPRKAMYIPPLKEPFQATYHVEISEAFRRHYFPDARDGLEEPLPEHRKPNNLFTEEDLWEAFRGMPSNVSPGISGMSTQMLGALMEHHTLTLTRLLNRCISLGHYPAALKRTVVAMVKKPKPYDPSTPRAYRPICVEESLAKLLERAVTLRLQTYIMPGMYFLPIQHGGRPGASVYGAWHDLYNRLLTTEDSCVGLVTFDVKGYFDNVDLGQLRHALRLHGVPLYLIQLIEAFACNRSIQFAFNGDHSQWFVKPNRGVPQGSPISPILANMAAMPVLHRLQDLPWLRFYMDDGGLVTSGSTPGRLIGRISEGLRRIGDEFADTTLMIDPGSVQFIAFRRIWGSQGRFTPLINQPLTYQKRRIYSSPSVTWLGIRIDKNLSFAPFVKSRVTAGHSTWSSLEWLTSRSRGLKARHMRTYYLQILRPVLYWGVPIWYMHAPHLAELFQPVHRRALMRCGGFLNFTPTATMEALLSIPPIWQYAAVEATCRNVAIVAHAASNPALHPRYYEGMWPNGQVSPAACAIHPELEGRANTIIRDYRQALSLRGMRYEMRHDENGRWIMVYLVENPFPPVVIFTLQFTVYSDLHSQYLIAFLRILRHIKDTVPAHYCYPVYIVSSYLPPLFSLERTKDPYTRHFTYLISRFLPNLRPMRIVFIYTPLRFFESPREQPEDFLDITLATVPGSIAYLKDYFLKGWQRANRRWVQLGHHTVTTPWRRGLLRKPSYDLLPPLKWPWKRKQEVRYLQTIANVSSTGTTRSRIAHDHSPLCPVDRQRDTVDHRLTTCMRYAALRYQYFYHRNLESPDCSLSFDHAINNAQFFFDLYRPP
ncbi:hypothetical protein ACEPAF_3261 [Sanghuangporus sanghuang]